MRTWNLTKLRFFQSPLSSNPLLRARITFCSNYGAGERLYTFVSFQQASRRNIPKYKCSIAYYLIAVYALRKLLIVRRIEKFVGEKAIRPFFSLWETEAPGRIDGRLPPYCGEALATLPVFLKVFISQHTKSFYNGAVYVGYFPKQNCYTNLRKAQFNLVNVMFPKIKRSKDKHNIAKMQLCLRTCCIKLFVIVLFKCPLYKQIHSLIDVPLCVTAFKIGKGSCRRYKMKFNVKWKLKLPRITC